MPEANPENEAKIQGIQELQQPEDPTKELNSFKSEIEKLKSEASDLSAEQKSLKEDRKNLNATIDLFNKKSQEKVDSYNKLHLLNEKAKASQPVIDYYTAEARSKFAYGDIEINKVFESAANAIKLDFDKLNQKSQNSVQNLQNQKQQARTDKEKYYISIKIELEKAKQARIKEDLKHFEDALAIKSKLYEEGLKLSYHSHANNVKAATEGFKDNGLSRKGSEEGDDHIVRLQSEYKNFVKSNTEAIRAGETDLQKQKAKVRSNLDVIETRLNNIFPKVDVVSKVPPVKESKGQAR